MADFADSLMDQYPIPPPPEPHASDLLGAFFGAAPDRTKSYAAGLEAGSQYRLRSAQGEKALEDAHMAREQRLGEEMKNGLLRKVQANPNYMPTPAESIFLAKGANDFASSIGNYQEQGFRDTLADPTAPAADQLAAGQGVQGKVLPQVQPLGPGREINLLTQDPYTNPVGQAAIDNYHETPAMRPGAGGFTLGGVRYNADGTPVVPIEDVAANAQAVAEAQARGRQAGNPGSGAGGKPLNEFQMKAIGQLNRMDRSEAIISKDFANYTPDLADVALDKVPLGGNYVTSEKYQKYKQAANEWISGLLRLDSGAAVPETEFKRYFDTFFPQPGQDQDVIAQKAAARVAAANALRAGLPPAAVLAAAGGAAPPAPGAPAAAAPAAAGTPSPKTQAEYNAIPSGTVYIDTDGQRKRKK